MKNLLGKRIFVILLLAFVGLGLANAQTVDTIEVYSKKMNRDIKNVVILPGGYDAKEGTKYPVLYLLHGYSGNQSSWLKIKPTLPQLATEYGMIIVCPNGENSWYWDSPTNPKSQFDTFVSKELVSYMDKNYATRADSTGRAITGLSMGGHGGLWLGINHQDVFGACGSMSGGVDIRPFPRNWEMKDQLGNYGRNAKRWNEYTVINQLDKIDSDALAIIIDCGSSDFFMGVNNKLHEELLYRNIKHDYIVRPGSHNNVYWENAIDYQLTFFSKFFNRK